jgi:hypothetical protein
LPSRTDLPTIEADTRPFWDAASDGKLLIRSCNGCSRAHAYPRTFCPYCWSEDVVWVEACGRATLYTWSVVYRNDLPPFGDQVPYAAAVVDLAEGPRMMTQVVDVPFEELAVDLPLVVTFRSLSDDIVAPYFTRES